MLYDPKWEQQTRADPFTLEDLIAWLKKHPAETQYEWHCPTACLLGQWLRDTGIPERHIEETSVHLTWRDQFMRVALRHPYTFGGALKRARAEIESR